MKLVLKILFLLLAIYQENISNAMVFVFENRFSETEFTCDVVEDKISVAATFKNDFATVVCGTPRVYTQVLKPLPSKGFIFRA